MAQPPPSPKIEGKGPIFRRFDDADVPLQAVRAQRNADGSESVGAREVVRVLGRAAVPVAVRDVRPRDGRAPARALQPAHRVRHRGRPVGGRRALPDRHPRRAAARRRVRAARRGRRRVCAVRGDDGRPALVGRRPGGRTSVCSPTAGSSRCPIRRSSTRPGSPTCGHTGPARSRPRTVTDTSRPQVSTRDRDSIQLGLERWLVGRRADATPRIVELTAPQNTGMSSDTVLFTVEWQEGGRVDTEQLVARLAPDPDAAPLFPEYDLERQYLVMDAVGARSAVPVPPRGRLRTRPVVRGHAVPRDGARRGHGTDRHPAVHVRRGVGRRGE